jgi:hypothetical protein
MKCPSVSRWTMAMSALVALAAQANAAELWNQASPSYDGYGDGGYAAGGYAAGAYANGSNGYNTAGYAQGMPNYGAPSLASYPAYGYAGYGYGYPGYGYGGYGYGGYGYGCGGAGCGGYGGCGHWGRRHCCGFSSNNNLTCCANAWDGFCGGGGYGCGVKVHRRHRPLGCGAGPCVDSSCGCLSSGYATNCGHGHRCHLRRNRFLASCGFGACSTCGCDGGSGMIMDQAPAQPGMSGPTPAESLPSTPPESPAPGDVPST